jgi:hypothetical protein
MAERGTWQWPFFCAFISYGSEVCPHVFVLDFDSGRSFALVFLRLMELRLTYLL